jgi:hypothetical protein
LHNTEPGQAFREAWIAGVHRHFPGTPKPGYVTPWQQTEAWEKACAATAEQVIRILLSSTSSAAQQLSRTQKGQFVAAVWCACIYQQIPSPKSSYVAPWEELPSWQQETDADIFDAIARAQTDAERAHG